MTTTALSEDPGLRTMQGGAKGWLRPGTFGVLLSHCSEVIDRTFEPRTEVWSDLTSAADAGQYGLRVARAQPGAEFEVMRLEAGSWRDFRGRTVKEVIGDRWGSP